MSKRKSQNKTEKQTSKKEKLGFFDDFLEHPNINSGLLGLLGTAYFSTPVIIQAIQQDMLPELLSENGLRMGLSWATLSIIARGAIMPFSKFRTPKVKNFLKFAKLESKLKKEYQQLKKENKLQPQLEELHSCFDENIGYYYLSSSELKIKNGDYEEGLDDLISYLRLGTNSRLGVGFKPISLLAEIISSFPYSLVVMDKKSLPEKRREAYYSLLSNQLFHNPNNARASAVANDINAQFHELDDKLAYGNIMSYLNGAKEEYWKPFFEKLSELLREQGKTLDNVVDKQADTRNKVIRFKNIYLKEYTQEDENSIETELANLKHFSKLDHVVSRAIKAHVEDKQYLVSPHSGVTLDKVVDDMETSKREEILRKAMQNLAEIQVLGTELPNIKVGQEYYLERIKELTKGYMKSNQEFLSAYAEVIAKEIAKADGLYYKDHNLKNILVEEDFVREIDFEKNLLKPPGIDVVSALEYGDHYDDMFVAEVLKEYYPKIEKYISQDFDDFRRVYEYLRVQRHLELPGYRVRDGLFSLVPFQISLAIDALERITRFNKDERLPYMIEHLQNNIELTG